jgi:hypothetical protein
LAVSPPVYEGLNVVAGDACELSEAEGRIYVRAKDRFVAGAAACPLPGIRADPLASEFGERYVARLRFDPSAA